MSMIKMSGSKVIGPFMLLMMVPALPFCVAGASAIFVLEKSGVRSLKLQGERLSRVSRKLGAQLNSFAQEVAQNLEPR